MIDAADKKLKVNSHFLEEQAAEREQERDEAQKIILNLQEQLKERDKDRVNCERINSEGLNTPKMNACCELVYLNVCNTVEQLELQMQSMNRLINDNEVRYNSANCERNEAVEKVCMLRDIIRNFESQIETKNAANCELKELVEQLEILAKQQREVNDELTKQLEGNEDCNEGRLKERIGKLEQELRKLRLSSDFAENEGALKQIQLQLHDFEITIDRRTKELEHFYTVLTTTTCSSPSEEMSIRDQIRPQTPNSTLDDCDVPLQQLARLKEKLVKHARAEDAAVKRIRDLEMHIVANRQELEEIQIERDHLQDQISEQVVIISSLQMRLDDQRLRAEHIQKQTNTSLEVKIYDLESEIQQLQEQVHTREKTIRQLNKNFDETKQRLEMREHELSSITEDTLVVNLQKIIDELKLENSILQTKISSDAQNSQLLPNIVDNIIADKNCDIEKLRDQLNDTQKHLNSFLALNLDFEQLRNLSNLKSSDKAFGDILSLIEVDESVDQLRKADSKLDSFNLTGMPSVNYYRKSNETTLFGSKSLNFEPDFSEIEQLAPQNVNFSTDLSMGKKNSTEIHKSVEKKVTFEDSRIEKLRNDNQDLVRKLQELSKEIEEKEAKLEEFVAKIEQIECLEKKIEALQLSYDNLKKITDNLELEKNSAEDNQKSLRVDLAERKMHLEEKIKELDFIKQDVNRKDQMYLSLAKEKKDLETKLQELQTENDLYKNVDDIITDKNKEIYLLEEKLGLLQKVTEKMDQLENVLSEREVELEDTKENYLSVKDELEEKSRDFGEMKEKYQRIYSDLKEKDKLNEKFEKELKNKTSQIGNLTEQLKVAAEDYRLQLDKKIIEIETETKLNKEQLESKIAELQNIVVDRECELDILKEDVTTYQNDIANLETQLKSGKNDDYDLKMMRNRKELAQKDLEIVKLKTNSEDLRKELLHVQDYLVEKDKVIEQMKTDAKSLHVNLETIQSKIQENGNVVDLKNRLQEEQALNFALQDEVNSLRNIISVQVPQRGNIMTNSIEEITGQVRKQLDYSAHLDSSILSAINSGGESLDDLSALKDVLKKEKMTNKKLVEAKSALEKDLIDLERKFELEKNNGRKLQVLLDNANKNCKEIQLEDSRLIEQLRIRLEAVLDNENQFETIIKTEKAEKLKLEAEIVALKLKLGSDNSNSRTDDTTEYRSLPNMNNHELLKLREDVKSLREENEVLKIEIRSFKRDKYEFESKVKYYNDMLEMKVGEIGKLEERLQKSREDGDSLKEKWLVSKAELDQRNREIDNTRVLMSEIEEEKREYKREVQKLNEHIREMDENEKLRELEKERNADLSSNVPDKFVRKMKDLSKLVKDHIEENKTMSNTVQIINEERRVLQARVRELEELNNIKMPFDDPVARANHLFGRYLRSESFRKSLVWQKRYLIALLATYQDAKPLFPRTISNEYLDTINVKPTQSKSRGIKKFRSTVLGIIATLRMQYLVKRWHSGRRQFIAPLPKYHNSNYNTNFNLNPNFNVNPNLNSNNSSNQNFQVNHVSNRVQFHVGQPVSGQSVSTGQPLSRTQHHVTGDRAQTPPSQQVAGSSGGQRRDLPPWSGFTPPSKDGTGGRNRRDSTSTELIPSTSSSSDPVNFVPLATPELITQYVDRFISIQQKLGLNS